VLLKSFEKVVTLEQFGESHADRGASRVSELGVPECRDRLVSERLNMVSVIMLVPMPTYFVSVFQKEVRSVLVLVENLCWYEPGRANLVFHLNPKEGIALAPSQKAGRIHVVK
jgi:hypothetical protein